MLNIPIWDGSNSPEMSIISKTTTELMYHAIEVYWSILEYIYIIIYIYIRIHVYIRTYVRTYYIHKKAEKTLYLRSHHTGR